MLRELLNPSECAKCKICCTFDDDDLWETPIIMNETADDVLRQCNAELKDLGDYKLFSLTKSGDDIYYCSALDRKKGCKLSPEAKPFDCKIWPFRAMKLSGLDRLVITLSPVCPIVKTRPLKDIMRVAQKIAPQIFAEAEKHPFTVKDYIEGYPILAIE